MMTEMRSAGDAIGYFCELQADVRIHGGGVYPTE